MKTEENQQVLVLEVTKTVMGICILRCDGRFISTRGILFDSTEIRPPDEKSILLRFILGFDS